MTRVALALSFGSAGICNCYARSVRRALYAARRKRRAMIAGRYWRPSTRRRVLELGGDLSTPMFIHDPARPAVLDPNGDALRREIEALRCD